MAHSPRCGLVQGAHAHSYGTVHREPHDPLACSLQGSDILGDGRGATRYQYNVQTHNAHSGDQPGRVLCGAISSSDPSEDTYGIVTGDSL